MDSSQVCGRKVRTLLFGVVIGIFAVVHSGFSNVVSQDEVYREAVTEGFLIDGFFLSPRSTALPKRPKTAEVPQRPSSQSKDSDVFDERLDAFHNISATESVELHQNSQQPSTESTDNSEGSGESIEELITLLSDHGGERHTSTTESAELLQSTMQPTTEFTDNFEGSGDSIEELITLLSDHGGERHTSTTESAELLQSTMQPTTEFTDNFEGSGDPKHKFLSLHTTTQRGLHTQNTEKPYSVTAEISMFERSGYTTDQVLFPNGERLTTTESSTAVVMQGDFEGSASGTAEIDKFFLSTSASPAYTTQTGSVSSNYRPPQDRRIVPQLMNPSFTNNVGQTPESQNPQPVHESPQSGHDRTPGWIIIVAFIVGVAALVMLCVAIATRDKWNRPSQASQPENNSVNQQRELEMETFLQKDHPRENGDVEEYTVIQLDDLADKYSSD